MPEIQISTPFNIDIEFEIAAFHKRLLAYLVDFCSTCFVYAEYVIPLVWWVQGG
jgi:hypothetical protein